MESIRWKFVTPRELLDYVEAHPEKEVGFTANTYEDMHIDGEPNPDSEPEGWYGVMFTKAFGGWSFVFGDYGVGIIWHDTIDSEDNYWILREFWKSEFSEKLTEDRLICVDEADMN